MAELPFDNGLRLLVQREVAWRDDQRVARLLKAAMLEVSSACIEDINWRTSRGVDRSLITALAAGGWLRHPQSADLLPPAHGIDVDVVPAAGSSMATDNSSGLSMLSREPSVPKRIQNYRRHGSRYVPRTAPDHHWWPAVV